MGGLLGAWEGGKGLEGYLRKTLEGFVGDNLENLREIWVLRDPGTLGEGGRFLRERWRLWVKVCVLKA